MPVVVNSRHANEILSVTPENPAKIPLKILGAESKTGGSPTFIQNVSHYFTDYCNATGVHGIRYIGERGRLLQEKLAWSISITVMCYFCISLILQAYAKWVSSPVIVSFATTETPIWDIPFPAVTICTEVKTDPEIFNYTKVLLKKFVKDNCSSEEERYFESLSLVCNGIANTKEFSGMFANANAAIDESAMDDLIHVMPNFDNYSMSLYWLGLEEDINNTISTTFTSEGLCYSFNMLHFDEFMIEPEEYVSQRSVENTRSKRWSLEEGYPKGEKIDAFPRRTFVSGIKGGVVMELFTNHSHLDYLCGQSIQGFQVTLHHPSQLPNMDRHFRVPLDQAVLVAIKPRMITVSDELKSYRPEARKCFFANERRLTFFKGYTQQNCLDECLSNYTLVECGCVPFYMPKYSSTPICGAGSDECIEDSKVEYLLHQANIEINSSKSQNTDCYCLPSCTSLEYDVEISQSDWKWRESYEVFQRFGKVKFSDEDFNYEKDHFSRLAVYYREMQFLTSQRHEVYGYVDFFSNTGGLLGLFIGFSVTSAIEIFYFLTLRLACNIKKYGSHYWSGLQADKISKSIPAK